MMIRLRAASLSVALFSFGSLAIAQDADPAAEAKRQYNLGTQAYSAHRFVEAALAFEAAASYKANAVTLYTAALAWEQGNQPERAADAFGRALELPGLLPQQQSNAKERVAALEKALGTLVVTGTDKTKVQLDSLTEVGVPARLHAAPGSHVLSIRYPDASSEKRDVVLELGTSTSLDAVKAATVTQPTPKENPPPLVPPPVDKPMEEKSATPITRFIGVGAIGAGVVAGVATIVLGLSANDAGNAYNTLPSREALDHANALATWTNVAWITGAVLVASGVALVLIPGGKAQPKAAVSAALGGVMLGGAF
jgi:tetratricopeptide (TPR) repeat protein